MTGAHRGAHHAARTRKRSNHAALRESPPVFKTGTPA
jgi:hypothetical protein